MMSIRRYVLAFVFLFSVFPRQCFATSCDDWIQHLAKDHDVKIVATRVGSKAQGLTYVPLKISNLTIVLPNDHWTVVKNTAETVEVQNKYFGYGISMKDGRCMNSYGYKGDSPRDREFNYDFEICKGVLEIFSEDRLKTYDAIRHRPRLKSDPSDPKAMFDNMRKKEHDIEGELAKVFAGLPGGQKKKLKTLLKQTDASPFTQSGLSAVSLFRSCQGQTEFLASTLDGQFSPSPVAPTTTTRNIK